MGFLLSEAAAMRRVAYMIQTLQASQPQTPVDARLQVAWLRSLFLAASIDGTEPEPLLRLAADLSETSQAPRVRAEAAYRLLMNELMRAPSDRSWDAPLTPAEWDLVDVYLTCYGTSPRAASAVKRLADDAQMRGVAADLRGCRDLVELAFAGHPVGDAFIGKARGLEAIGKSFAPSMRTLDGAPLDWMRLRGRPVVMLLIDIAQTPSADLLIDLANPLHTTGAADYTLVVVQVDVTASRPATSGGIEGISNAERAYEQMASNRRVRLAGGWREPLLEEFDIRTLPTAMVLDRDGVLRNLIRHDGWTMAESIRTALDDLAGPIGVPTPSTNPAPGN